ncbi:MAG: phosphatidylethanolamine-binding protein [Candidatus Omnitrophica bacterium CG1_02_49_10]|nr:MAG: phosphatidylethanolamine-binding protein [Candidatus Omnitrophica bacterium CG1_02_49_10]
MALEISSNSFQNNEYIPKRYTGEGEDTSPHLSWNDVPEGTKSFAMINDDPDAPMGTWIHWIMYDIPAAVDRLDEAISKDAILADGSKQGITSFGRVGYGGPMPPPGKPHRYFFKLYALDINLNLKEGATKKELLKAMEGHILAEAQLVGLYKR